MATTTTGWHRIGSVTTRATFGLEQQTVPGASIYVTSTATGLAATIYSDPLLSIAIVGSVLFADKYGNFDYYLPLNYCVTEAISAPNGSLTTEVNISQNGPIVSSFTTTGSISDTIPVTGALSTSHIFLQPTNAAAATMYTSTYVYSKANGSFVVMHPATAGATFDILVTPY